MGSSASRAPYVEVTVLRRFPLLLMSLALVAACNHGAPSAGSTLPGASKAPTAAPAIAAAGATGTTVPWSSPLTLVVSHGTLENLTATAADGAALAGTITETTWTSATTLVPTQTYAV